MDGHTPPTRSLPYNACESLAKQHPDKVVKVCKDGMKSTMSWSTASNPETWGLDPMTHTALGHAHADWGTLRQRSYTTMVWFVVTPSDE